jgi:hypothetical protein
MPGVARDSVRNEGIRDINYGIKKIIICNCCAAAQQQDQRENSTCLLSLPSNSLRTDPKEKARFYKDVVAK